MTSLYDNWVFERWETPASDGQSLALVSLSDAQARLSLVLEAPRDPQRRRFQADFTRYPGYRNLLEAYRLELWQILAGNAALGWTLQVSVSPWIAELKQHEPLLEAIFPNLKHWLIRTEDDVIEVLSDERPTFWEIGPATAESPVAGKPTILYSPEDRAEMEQIISEIEQHQLGTND